MPRKVRHQYWPVMQPRAIEWVRIGGKRKRWDEQFESSGWTIHNKCEWNFLFDIPFVVLTILFSKCVLHSMKRFPSVQPTLLFFIALCVVRLIFGLSSAWLSFNVIWFSLFHLLYSCARAYWNIPMHKPVNIECEFLCCALFFHFWLVRWVPLFVVLCDCHAFNWQGRSIQLQYKIRQYYLYLLDVCRYFPSSIPLPFDFNS